MSGLNRQPKYSLSLIGHKQPLANDWYGAAVGILRAVRAAPQVRHLPVKQTNLIRARAERPVGAWRVAKRDATT
jgi:hypothetical protein